MSERIKIAGTFDYVKRDMIKCPEDGVHRQGKDGYIKGVHSLLHNEKNLIPKGQDCFYYRLDFDKGVQVYYSFGWFKPHKKKAVIRNCKRLLLFSKLGLSPKPHKIVPVKLDITYRAPNKRKHIREDCYGVIVDHVQYPEDVWDKYAKGHPYEFDNGNPNDSPRGYLDFCEKVKKVCKAKGIKLDSSLKLGDVVYCIKRGRWFLVDVD